MLVKLRVISMIWHLHWWHRPSLGVVLVIEHLILPISSLLIEIAHLVWWLLIWWRVPETINVLHPLCFLDDSDAASHPWVDAASVNELAAVLEVHTKSRLSVGLRSKFGWLKFRRLYEDIIEEEDVRSTLGAVRLIGVWKDLPVDSWTSFDC